jgi:hypothetical protein
MGELNHSNCNCSSMRAGPPLADILPLCSGDFVFVVRCCFQIDVTDVPAGRYLLRIEVNSGRSLPETTHENNVATVDIEIP